MNALKVLGNLLGNKQMTKRAGREVLSDLLGGNQRQTRAGRHRQQQSQRRATPVGGSRTTRRTTTTIGRTQSRSPLGQSSGRTTTGRSTSIGRSSIGRSSIGRSSIGRSSIGRSRIGVSGRIGTAGRPGNRINYGSTSPAFPYSAGPIGGNFRNHQAVFLIRAMINAAKADGQVDREEYSAIFARTHGLTQAEIQFLRNELECPLDLIAFVRDVPRGLEVAVYKASLAGIRWDNNYETEYLAKLAHALSISNHECNRIHNSLGLPVLF